MSQINATELAVLGALAASRGTLQGHELAHQLERAGVGTKALLAACETLLGSDLIAGDGHRFVLTPAGSRTLLEVSARLHDMLDSSPSSQGTEHCPSIPFLTTVQTAWREAVSINYAVDPDALAAILPEPLEPDLCKGVAWVQVLMSSLRDMRPQGTGSIFGVNFHQVSYRAAVKYRSRDGLARHGGYFVRSETDHSLMRTIGNSLKEFKFHEFGLADMMMLREGRNLTVGVSPVAEHPGGNLIATFETHTGQPVPASSVFTSVEEMQHTLIDCYDAYGISDGYVYILTIDRAAWDPHFVTPTKLYCEYFDTGPLSGAARLDSVLHLPKECAYRWRPLRRERWA